MKKLIVLVFSIMLFVSCGSKKVLSERLKHDWKINYLENDDVNNSFTTIKACQYVNEYPNNILSNELENESFTASTKTVITNNKKELTSLLRNVRELEIDGDCDNIIFKNGDELSAKVIEITAEFVKYRKCDNQEGPLISVSKKEILKIMYKNGTKEIFNNPKQSSSNNITGKSNLKVERLSITSIITPILAALLPFSGFSTVLILCSLFFSFFGLYKINKNPERFKGKQFAFAGLAISVVLGIYFVYTYGW